MTYHKLGVRGQFVECGVKAGPVNRRMGANWRRGGGLLFVNVSGSSNFRGRLVGLEIIALLVICMWVFWEEFFFCEWKFIC